MTYSAQYAEIIERRLANPLMDGEYGEVHHIIPKSEGGNDDNENLVRLTAREHYVCHLLLAKIYDDVKMYSALVYMQCKTSRQQRDFKFNSRLYARMREEFARKQSTSKKGRHWYTDGKRYIMQFECPEGFVPGAPPMPDEQRRKISARAKLQTGEKNPFYGKKHTDEARKKMSDAAKRRPGLFGEKNGMYGKHLSDITKEKISKVQKGKPKSAETREKMKANNANKSPVLQFTKDGVFIAEYKTMTEAELATGIRHGQIRRVILGLSSYGEFIWQYKESSE